MGKQKRPNEQANKSGGNEPTDLVIFSNPEKIKVDDGNKIIQISPKQVSVMLGRPFKDTIVIPKTLVNQLNTAYSQGYHSQLTTLILKNRQQMVIFSMGEAGYGIRTDTRIQKGTPLVFYPGIVESRQSDLSRSEYAKGTTVVLQGNKFNESYVLNAENNCGFGSLLPFLPKAKMLEKHFKVSKNWKDKVACENLNLEFNYFNYGVRITFISANQDLQPGSVIGWDYGMNYFLNMMYQHTNMSQPAFMLFDKQGKPINSNHYIPQALWVLYKVGNNIGASTVDYKKVLEAIKKQESLTLEYQRSAETTGNVLIPFETLEKLFVKHISTYAHLDLLTDLWEEAREDATEIFKMIEQRKVDPSPIAQKELIFLRKQFTLMSSCIPTIEERNGLLGIATWLVKRNITKEPASTLEREMYFDDSKPPSVIPLSTFKAAKSVVSEIPEQKHEITYL
jgi:hypothetical protein